MIYSFSNFKIDQQIFCLYKNEVVIDIEPQVFNIILYLLENREKIISRDELLENLWHGKEVLDATISNHIKIARALLGDDGQKQSVIKTIRGRGYQFIAQVNVLIDSENEQLIERKNNTKLTLNLTIVLYILLFSVISSSLYYALNSNLVTNSLVDTTEGHPKMPRQSIAILPFQNRSNRKEDQFFTDGFHDDLLTQVSKIEKLKTISRTSVMQYRETTKNLKVIAKELGVTTILEGGVQRSGGKIRINIQLIDAESDQHIWASTFTRKLNAKNVFVIQSEISAKIASALKLALIVSANKLPTQNMEALELYFKAKSVLVEKTSYSNKIAIEHLKQTLLVDPNFSLAQAELASRYLDQVKLDGIDRKKQITLAQPLVDKSLSLAPDKSLVYKVDGKLKMYQGDGASAKISFEKAIILNHNNSEAIASYAIFQMYAGNLNEAIELLSSANELSPKDLELQAKLALMLMRDSRFAESDILLDKIIAENPTFAKAYKVKSDIAFYGKHDFQSAIANLMKSISIDQGYIEGRRLIADRYIDLGMNEKAIYWLNQFIDLIPGTRKSELAKAKIFELQEEYNKAFEIYQNQIYHPHHLLYAFLNVAKITGRTTEAIEHCKNISPAFFTSDLEIETRRMTSAFMLGSVLVNNKDPLTDEHQHGLLLLERSLKISQRNINGSRQSKHFDWETRILLALGKKELALESFKEWINLGFYSNLPLEHSDYESLRDNKEFQDLIKIIKTKIFKNKPLKENELTS